VSFGEEEICVRIPPWVGSDGGKGVVHPFFSEKILCEVGLVFLAFEEGLTSQ